MSIASSPKTNNLDPENWEMWSEHLAKRKKPRAVCKAIPSGKTSALFWAMGPSAINDEARSAIEHLFHLSRRKEKSGKIVVELLEKRLDDTIVDESLSASLESLAWCQALPKLAELVPAAAWSQLFDRLNQTAQDAVAISYDETPLVHQLLAGELAFTLAYLFPELAASDDLADSARASISIVSDELLDGRGLPRANHLPAIRQLLACWTRCAMLARSMKSTCFTDSGQIQFEWLVRQSLRLSRRDGSQVFGDRDSGKWEKQFRAAALLLSVDLDDKAIAESALNGRKPKPKTSKTRLPASAYHSEWAETVVLRSSWARKSPALTLTYSDRSIRSELNCGRDTIWSGDWNPTIYVDENEMRPQSDWSEVCWHSDKDADYVELEIEYGNDWKLQRQILLVRKDQVLLVGDAMLGKQKGRIDYHCTLPLCDGVGFDAAAETREGVLYRNKRLGLVIPLALPEWRTELVDDYLSLSSGGLTLHQQQFGRALYAPLWIDLKPSRFAKELTWRQLTVADQLAIQPPDVAVGYRVQTGKSQWLAYRSMAERRSRTLLGKNFFCEFFAGRFLTTGETEEILQIE